MVLLIKPSVSGDAHDGQHAREGIDRGARRKHIVDKEDSLTLDMAGQSRRNLEGTAHIELAPGSDSGPL